jgi:hypothetical protein
MSKKENDVKIVMSKKSDSAKLKELSKIEGQHLNVSEGIDNVTLTLALKKKTQMEELERQLKELETQYQALRNELLGQVESIENSEYDSIEYVNNGQRLYKYPKNSKAGKLDEQKLTDLARAKKLYSKIFKKVVVVDESALIKALQQGKISADEFRSVTLQQISPVIEIKYVQTEKVANDTDNDGDNDLTVI